MKSLEWDIEIPLTCVLYNFLPNKPSKESPYFLCSVGTPLPLNSPLNVKSRYLGTEENILSLEALKNIYQGVATIFWSVQKK